MMNLTPHEKDVIALVLREHADDMDKGLGNLLAHLDSPVQDYRRCRESAVTAEMREIAHKVEWSL